MNVLWAKNVEKYDIIRPRVQTISFKEACEIMGYKDLLLIEALDTIRLDCMGRIVKAMDVCQKKLSHDKNLLRGTLNSKNKNLICSSGEGAILAVNCKMGTSDFCKQTQKSCLKLKSFFAHDLELGHHFTTETRLNCHYVSKLEEENLLVP